MTWRNEWKALAWLTAAFIALYFLPLGVPRFDHAVFEALALAKWYTREHVVLCLLPAFLIAGAIGVFVSKASVMRYLGAGANRVLAYGVASVSGTVLAVCSCTVLPLFAGIYRMGAGLGPATAFLYSGPAINVLAIILTARILGWQIGLARAVGAVVFSIVIGLLMHVVFRREEGARAESFAGLPSEQPRLRLWQTALYFGAMVAVLIFANWANPGRAAAFWQWVFAVKWPLTALAALALAFMLWRWFGAPWWKLALVAGAVVALAWAVPGSPMIAFAVGVIGLAVVASSTPGALSEWLGESWGFAKLIAPLLFAGVLLSGFALGRPGQEGLVPSAWIGALVGGNSLWANLFAAVVGALMYFATLTEVPIVQGLLGSGMGQGPALALLLAGPALSLPSMLVINSILGWRKTVVYISLVVVMATLTGLAFGALVT
jgi:hypothetical protein